MQLSILEQNLYLDVNEKTGCISIDKIEKALTSKTKAIIVVHFVGLPCEMDKNKKC